MLNRFITVAVIVVGLFGCSSGGSKTVTGQEVTDLLPTFQKGELRLTCDTACSGAWGSTRKRAKSLYENQLWTDLAVEVANVGHRVDLTYFYLGRAAEGLGYPDAARTYFNLALANRYKCNGYINNCDGIEVTSEANAGLLRLPKSASVPVSAIGASSSSPSIGSVTEMPTPVAPPAPKVEPVRSELRGTVKVEYDEFKKQTRYTGSNVSSGNDYVALRAWRTDKGSTAIQIYVADYYVGEWRFYNSAWDSDGTRLDFVSISRDVGSCSRYSGCSHTEHVGLNVTKSYLEKNRISGVRFKLSGKAGDEVFTLPGEHISAFLDALRQ